MLLRAQNIGTSLQASTLYQTEYNTVSANLCSICLYSRSVMCNLIWIRILNSITDSLGLSNLLNNSDLEKSYMTMLKTRTIDQFKQGRSACINSMS